MAKIQNMPADVRDRYKSDTFHIRNAIEAEKKEIKLQDFH